MSLKNINPTTAAAWEKLTNHYQRVGSTAILEHFHQDPERATRFSITWKDFLVDYSKNRITTETLDLLIELGIESGLNQAIESYFSGDPINKTEGRAVLHTALRGNENSPVYVEGINIMPEVALVKQKMKTFSEAIIGGVKTGFTGKAFTDVVNIGIGGSDLGPAMVVDALKFYGNHLNLHFVSNVDGDHVYETLKKLDPETTLFVIVSKTFTTQETLSNALTAKAWFLKHASASDIALHFAAVSTNTAKIEEFGIVPEHVFPMWDWVGGRFSLWSAVGLSIALAVGFDHFEDLLLGAGDMDQHFRTAPHNQNIPVILGLISVWYNNFYGAETEAIIPYTQYLQRLPAYLQQGIMESNGKSVDRNGNRVNYQTGTIIWGEPGTNSQHAFFQLIHQGTKLIPSDFIGYKHSLYGDSNHHLKLMANFFAQTEALMNGKDANTVKKELTAQGLDTEALEALLPFKVFEGNKPTNTLLIERLTPRSLGSLIAMYEHKIFVQGVVWNIFSYDQWGVELGKQLANTVLQDLTNDVMASHDPSTMHLLQNFKR